MRWVGGGVDTRNLELRRQGWYCVKDVPAKLAPIVGRKRLRRTLKTRDLGIARLRRPSVLAALEREIAVAAAQVDHTALLDHAFEIRDTLRDDPVVEVHDLGHGETEEWHASHFAEDYLDELTRTARKAGHPDPMMLRKVAAGDATPLAPMLEAWLVEADIEARSKGDHRRALGELIEWGRGEGLTPAAEAFDRRVAGRYVSSLVAGTLAKASVGKRLWSLSQMWAWLIAKGHVETQNPWKGHSVSQPGRSDRDKEPERPFTDAEVTKLLAGTSDKTLLDMMLIGALSGMRIEEIARLQVRDVDIASHVLTARADPKTTAARRPVPVHPDLQAMILERIKGQPPEAFVIAELGGAPKEGRARSMAISKRFGRYREEVGVAENRDGQRRSLVNYHSFRRWFITKAEQAGQQENIIKSVVGHKRAGVTLGTYSGGASLDQRRACVEAVRFP